MKQIKFLDLHDGVYNLTFDWGGGTTTEGGMGSGEEGKVVLGGNTQVEALLKLHVKPEEPSKSFHSFFFAASTLTIPPDLGFLQKKEKIPPNLKRYLLKFVILNTCKRIKQTHTWK